MGKYLHYYENESNFKDEYYDDGGIVSFVCSGGTFTYDRYDTIDDMQAHIWVNGDKELITYLRTPKVGTWDSTAGTGAWDYDEGIGVEITAVGEVVPGKYHAPWVSATECNLKNLTIHAGELDYECKYIGEVDVYKDETE